MILYDKWQFPQGLFTFRHQEESLVLKNSKKGKTTDISMLSFFFRAGLVIIKGLWKVSLLPYRSILCHRKLNQLNVLNVKRGWHIFAAQRSSPKSSGILELFGSTPRPVTVTIRIVIFLVGNPNLNLHSPLLLVHAAKQRTCCTKTGTRKMPLLLVDTKNYTQDISP